MHSYTPADAVVRLPTLQKRLLLLLLLLLLLRYLR
jgi:hypothetical protein